MNKEIPEYLRSTYNLIQSSFPNGISESQYYPLLALLYEYLSDRNLAEVIAIVTGKDYGVVLNDTYKVGAGQNFDEQSVTNIKELMLPHGFIEWSKEE